MITKKVWITTACGSRILEEVSYFESKKEEMKSYMIEISACNLAIEEMEKRLLTLKTKKAKENQLKQIEREILNRAFNQRIINNYLIKKLENMG